MCTVVFLGKQAESSSNKHDNTQFRGFAMIYTSISNTLNIGALERVKLDEESRKYVSELNRVSK